MEVGSNGRVIRLDHREGFTVRRLRTTEASFAMFGADPRLLPLTACVATEVTALAPSARGPLPGPGHRAVLFASSWQRA